MGKIRVEELAAQMGIGSKEVLFLLQSIGVDVKSPQAALDESTVLAILQGKTHAPKQLIVRDTESRAPRPQKSALSRIKIIEKPPGAAEEPAVEAPRQKPEPRAARAAVPAEPARTAVIDADPEPEALSVTVPPAGASPPPAAAPPPPAAAPLAATASPVAPAGPPVSAAGAPAAKPLPRKIILPPRPVVPSRPLAPGRPSGPSLAPPGAAGRPMGPASGAPSRPMGPSGGPISRPMGPASGTPGRPMGPSGPAGPSVYRPTPGGPGARPLGGPGRVGAPMGRPGAPALGRPTGPAAGRGTAPPATAERAAPKRKKDDKEDAKKNAKKGGAKPKITVADEVDLREFVGTYQEDTYSDISLPLIEKTDGEEAPTARPISKSALRRAAKETRTHDSGKLLEFKKPLPTGPVFLSEGVTVKELSEKLGVLAKDILRLLMQRGIMATVNQPLDAQTAIQIAKEVGAEAAVVSFEEELELSRAADSQSRPGESEAAEAARVPRAPVVTVMGHVDHGKTSLLDAIRQANVAAGEAGGITQHIGAYRVETHGKPIVFLDTPGHEAFTSMRARGAKATDIVVLVVAADDGVMPQTIEAIDHARAAKVPIVVAINKIDKNNANPDRVKKELADRGVLLESWGGDIPSAEISALKKEGIDHLLELILLVAELQELKAPVVDEARGVVLEARREIGRGNLATVLVQAGNLKVGDVFFAGSVFGRVRSMQDDRGVKIEIAGPATPVEVTGFEDLPQAGDTFQGVEDEAKARSVVAFRQAKDREKVMAASSKFSLDQLFSKIQEGRVKDLSIVLKADVAGSVEVLNQSLSNLSNEKVKVSVIHAGVGAININDVLLASASRAIIVGFNVRPEKKAETEAEKAGVDIRLHTVIYNVTDEIKLAMEGLLDPTLKEVAQGRAEVRNTFKVPKFGIVAGCYVTEGSISRTSKVRLLRDNRVIYEGKIGSLRRFKDDISEVKQGFECGIGLEKYQDVKVGDIIEAYQVEKVAGVMNG
ncbi:MAG: translation initiation factor IF-2 [Acidobacteria bacterium]|nr:translation initiation factor IF-2 [Acidobacteriota bacterium]MCA1610542.1 translation initiation factor IF-2 [Acidobacteriota bacterium]